MEKGNFSTSHSVDSLVVGQQKKLEFQVSEYHNVQLKYVVFKTEWRGTGTKEIKADTSPQDKKAT